MEFLHILDCGSIGSDVQWKAVQWTFNGKITQSQTFCLFSANSI